MAGDTEIEQGFVSAGDETIRHALLAKQDTTGDAPDHSGHYYVQKKIRQDLIPAHMLMFLPSAEVTEITARQVLSPEEVQQAVATGRKILRTTPRAIADWWKNQLERMAARPR